MTFSITQHSMYSGRQLPSIIFVSGIDTNIGKTVATGWYARKLAQQGYNVITQKFVQTGCQTHSEDIMEHRQIQGISLTKEDEQGTTCPYIFHYPCSPLLAAKLENKTIEDSVLDSSTRTLQQAYDVVLIEGTGGLDVPYREGKTTLNYIEERKYPIVLVTSSRLGSISHTLLCLRACQQHNIPVLSVIYNLYPENDLAISQDTQFFLHTYLEQHFPETSFETMEKIPEYSSDLLLKETPQKIG